MSTTMTTTTTDTAITAKQAAKRIGTPLYVIHDAIEAKQLSAITHKKGYLLNSDDFDRWIEGLSAGEAAAVLPCKRRGCYAEADKIPHNAEVNIRPDGQPIHGRYVADSLPCNPDGTRSAKNFGPEGAPDSWWVGIQAVGEGAWEIYVELESRAFPPSGRGLRRPRVSLPDTDGLMAALTEAAKLRDRLNSA